MARDKRRPNFTEVSVDNDMVLSSSGRVGLAFFMALGSLGLIFSPSPAWVSGGQSDQFPRALTALPAVEMKARVQGTPLASEQQRKDLLDALDTARGQLEKEEDASEGVALLEGRGDLEKLVSEADSCLHAPRLGAHKAVVLTAALERASVTSEKLLGRYADLEKNLRRLNANGRVSVYAFYLDDGAPIYSYGADKKFTPASTYKLFIAYSMLKAVEDGKAKWGQQLTGGQTLAQCFDNMIIYSDNACPEAWLRKVGNAQMDQRAKELCAKNTRFTGGGFQVTAEDLSTAMRELLVGDAINQTSRTRLRNALENQVFRDGVPAAFDAETVVGGKVGFLRGYLHEVAFVESDKGDFVVTVLTENKSWSVIADVTADIYELMPKL